MRRRMLFLAVWLLGVAGLWVGLQATASWPVPFDPEGRAVVGWTKGSPRVAIATAVGRDPRGWPLYSGPVELWDLDAGRQVASYSVVPDGWQYNTWAAGRWLRVLPVDPGGQDRVPVLYDLTDCREVCRAVGDHIYWSVPDESDGRLVILEIDDRTGVYSTTVYDPATGAVAWSTDVYSRLVAREHLVCCPVRKGQPGEPAGPWTVYRTSDGVTVGVVPQSPWPVYADEHRLLTADGQMWDLPAGTVRYRLSGIPGQHTPHKPGLSQDGRWLIVLRQTADGPAVCWHDPDTGIEEVARRQHLPEGRPLLTVRPDGVVQVRTGEPAPPDRFAWLRNWLPLPPPAPSREAIRRYEANSGRRLTDADPATWVERPNGRPLLTADPDGRPERVWADRPDWLFAALAAGWAVMVVGTAWLVRRASASRLTGSPVTPASH